MTLRFTRAEVAEFEHEVRTTAERWLAEDWLALEADNARLWKALGRLDREFLGDAASRLDEAERRVLALIAERDAMHAQLTNVGITPYLDRMRDLAMARDCLSLVEWVNCSCPWCGGIWPDGEHPDPSEYTLFGKTVHNGHRPDCPRQLALKRSA